MRVAVQLASCLILCAAAYAQFPSDWRMIGGTADEFVFFDAGSLRKLPDGHLEVWLKILPMKAVNKEANKPPSKERVARVGTKVASGYVPPIGLMQKLTSDEIVDTAVREDIADEANIEPTMRVRP